MAQSMRLFKLLSLSSICAAIISHGAASSPFPKELGTAEIVVGTFSLLAAASGLMYLLCRPIFEAASFRSRATAMLFMIYLSGLPTVTGLVNSNSIHDISRDLIPLGIVFLAVFLPWDLTRSECNFLLASFTSAGLIISLRYLDTVEFEIADLYNQRLLNDGFQYLSYDCAVYFSSAFLLAMFGRWIGVGFPRSLLALSAALGALLSLAPAFGSVQRAPVALALCVLLIAVYERFSRSVFGVAFGILVVSVISLSALLVYAGEAITPGVFGALAEKNSAFGLNRKDAEGMAVLEVVSSSLGSMVFGIGWGGLLESEVYNLPVRFTHSVFTFLILKTGLVGFSFGLVAIALLIGRIVSLLALQPAVALGLLAPLAISLLVQPTYKSFSFSICLYVLIALSQSAPRWLARNTSGPLAETRRVVDSTQGNSSSAGRAFTLAALSPFSIRLPTS